MLLRKPDSSKSKIFPVHRGASPFKGLNEFMGREEKRGV